MSGPNSFLVQREELMKALAPKPGGRKASAMEVYQWARGAMSGPQNEYYRYYAEDDAGHEISIDADMERIAQWVATDAKKAGVFNEEARFALRRIWDFLIQNFAFGEAWRVGSLFPKRKETLWQRVSRRIGWVYPRLAIAVQVGYAVLLGATDLRRFLRLMAEKSVWLYGGMLLVFAFGIGVLKVEQRMGYESLTRVVERSLRLFAVGLGHAAIGFGVQGLLRWHLGLAWDARYAALYAAAALCLGFVFQLVWQDRPIGAPVGETP